MLVDAEWHKPSVFPCLITSMVYLDRLPTPQGDKGWSVMGNFVNEIP